METVIDSSKISLKSDLLHNGNNNFSVPVGHSMSNKKECYTNLELVLSKLKYCVMNGLYKRNSELFLCFLSNREDTSNIPVFCLNGQFTKETELDQKEQPVTLNINQCITEYKPVHTEYKPLNIYIYIIFWFQYMEPKNNVIWKILADLQKVLLPTLIKLGLMKQFIKDLSKTEIVLNTNTKKFLNC